MENPKNGTKNAIFFPSLGTDKDGLGYCEDWMRRWMGCAKIQKYANRPRGMIDPEFGIIYEMAKCQ